MRKLIHILLRKRRIAVPALHPRPRLDIRDTVLALALAGEVVARLAGVFAAEVDLEHAEDAQGLVFEAVDGVFDLLGRGAREVVDLALVSRLVLGCVEEVWVNGWMAYGAPLPCQKKVHWRHSLRSRSSAKPNLSSLSYFFRR